MITQELDIGGSGRDTLKAGLKDMWGAGDYGVIAEGMRESAESYFAERIGAGPRERVLDVACGCGQITLPAARVGAEVTGLDLSEEWLEQARRRAAAEDLAIRFDEGDAEDMPYEDASFELVTSLIGVMFAPDPTRASAEMLRVCKPGGRIVLGNWSPDGFVGRFFKMVSGYMPPPDMPSPLLWGDPDVVRERLGPGCSDVTCEEAIIHFDYPMPPDRVAEHYLAHFGPTKMAADALDEGRRDALRRDLEGLWSGANTARDGTTQVDAEILHIDARKSGLHTGI